jgi:hypothetical protein
MKIEFYQQIFKNPQISNLMKIHPMGPGFHADRRTDMTKLIVAFRNFANSPKNVERYDARFETPVFESFVFLII